MKHVSILTSAGVVYNVPKKQGTRFAHLFTKHSDTLLALGATTTRGEPVIVALEHVVSIVGVGEQDLQEFEHNLMAEGEA